MQWYKDKNIIIHKSKQSFNMIYPILSITMDKIELIHHAMEKLKRKKQK